jgi:hypothetical protein
MQLEDRKLAFYRHKEAVLLLVLAIAAPLAFALYTGNIWEDYFITFRHSQHLCEGKGLVYNVGERVHGFTSPLGVLLPALCYFVTGQTSYVPALWLFRALCIAAFVSGGWLVLRKIIEAGSSRWTTYAFVLLYCLEAKTLAFSVNGMETALMLLFVGWTVFLWDRQSPRTWLWRGIAWAGLMWTRPDGCIYIAALAITEMFWGLGNRRRLLLSYLKSAGLTTVIYLPWLLFAIWYYGSAIPQTIQAKTPVGIGDLGVGGLLERIYFMLPHRAAYAYAPIYFPTFWLDGPDWVYKFTYATGIFALVYWLLPVNDRFGRTASFCFTMLSLYVAYVALPFPWYLPPVTLFASITFSRGIVTLANSIAGSAAANGLVARASQARTALALCCLGFAILGVGVLAVLGMTVKQIYVQEHEIEMGNRREIGLWLKDHVHADETVFLEPIGYIGYFSQVKIVDWPGLVSPRVVQLRREGVTLEKMPNELKPNWVIFRPHEVKKLVGENPSFLTHYQPIKVFDVKRKLRQYEPIPGENYVKLDSTFLVFKRKTSPDETAVPADLQSSARECDLYVSQLLASPEQSRWMGGS